MLSGKRERERAIRSGGQRSCSTKEEDKKKPLFELIEFLFLTPPKQHVRRADVRVCIRFLHHGDLQDHPLAYVHLRILHHRLWDPL